MSDPSTATPKKFVLYDYDPSFAAAVIFIILFSLASVYHLFLLIRRRTWYFIPFFIGCLFEAVGYVGRSVNANEESGEWTLTPYIVQSLLILLGPTLYAASIYMVLGRLIMFLDAEEHAVIRRKWLTKIFVMGDVLSFLAQSAGGGMLAKAKSQSDQDLGNNVILAGLGIQVIFFGLFVVTAIIFHVRITKRPTPTATSTNWQKLILALYVTSLLILVRSLYRMVEYAMGSDGELMKKEGYLLAMDSTLMWLVSAVFAYVHPSKVLVGYKYNQTAGMASREVLEGDAESTYPMVSRDGTGGLNKGGRAKPYDGTTDGSTGANGGVQGHGRQQEYGYDSGYGRGHSGNGYSASARR
ncbi:hypothetical protein QBC46DRAFT_162369 [Diplogelasinospora grovesii]|uniref:Uncharacterized protein n=1 Tax=Diplogelasinospora grovesii TaxID=303347 RepID=A0AAN6N3K2_9PEZI|nr:hypothetical protein QBC46DRAFT_162369 [Diplogelasinospora grovesii]